MTNRFYCWTLNNPDGALDVTFEQWLGNGLRYAVYQHEVGESGTEHFQGYLELDRGQRFSYVTSRIPGVHLEPRRGTQQQAIDYCKKEEGRLDGPFEFGTPTPGQGARQDIQAFKALIDGGASDKEVWDTMPGMYLRYERTLAKVRMLSQPKRTWKTEVHLLYGPPGSGKSKWCEKTSDYKGWSKQPNTKWFCGYAGEPDVIFDDYKAWLPWANLLQIMDEYPLTVETKNGQVNWIAKRLFITTNFLPHTWYGKDDGGHKYPLAALTRRIDRYYLFEEKTKQELIENGPVYKEFDNLEEFSLAATSFRATNNNNNVIDIDD